MEVRVASKRHIKETLRNALKRAKGLKATGLSKLNVPQVLEIILEYVQAARNALAPTDAAEPTSS